MRKREISPCNRGCSPPCCGEDTKILPEKDCSLNMTPLPATNESWKSSRENSPPISNLSQFSQASAARFTGCCEARGASSSSASTQKLLPPQGSPRLRSCCRRGTLPCCSTP